MNAMSPTSKKIAVVGGGITGLCAAHRLASQGYKVSLFEASARLGGSVGSLREGGWLIEKGPNTLLDGEPALAEIVSDLGLSGELVAGSSLSKNRYIVRGGRLQALPLSPPSLLTSRLFSLGMKLRIFGELRQKPRSRPEDVSLEQFILDHFGREAVDYGLNPFVSGVYAGDPSRLSARYSFPKLWEIEQQHGSIIRGQIAAAKERKARGGTRPKIVSFRKGLQVLVDALEASLPEGTIHLNARVQAIRSEPRWSVEWQSSGSGYTDRFDAVLLALPAGALAELEVGAAGERPLAPLKGVEHPPVSSLFLGYRREQIKHPLDGFGALIPAVENRQALGVLFSSSLFEGRAPEGHVALTVMVGGMRKPELGRLSEEELYSRIKPDLTELLGAEGEPVFRRLHSWPAAIPQYNLGYGRFLDLMQDFEQKHPGLHLGGNSRDGIAVPNCMASGLRLASCVS